MNRIPRFFLYISILFILLVCIFVIYNLIKNKADNKHTIINKKDNATIQKTYQMDAETAWRKGKVYKYLIPAAARYQLKALNSITKKIDKNSHALKHIFFYMALDHIILSLFDKPYKKFHLNEATKFLNKIMPDDNIFQIAAITEMIEQIAKQQQYETHNFTNKLIELFRTNQDSNVDLFEKEKSFKTDFISLSIGIWDEKLILYNPINLIDLSNKFLDQACMKYKDSPNKRNLFYLLDSLYLMEKYNEMIKIQKNPNNSIIFKTSPYHLLKVTSAYEKQGNMAKVNQNIKQFNFENKYLFFEYALFIAEVKDQADDARNIILQNKPKTISPKLSDYHFLKDSRFFSDTTEIMYYRTLGKIYLYQGNKNAAFSCLYYTYDQSFGLEIKKYDPFFLSIFIDLALNQNVRPILEEYILRPPDSFGAKSFIDLYPGAYPIMYYYGVIITTE